MLPKVVLHNGVTVDGRMDWSTSEGDIGLYYELAAYWKADAMLSGSDTLLAAYSADQMPEHEANNVGPPELHPLHVPLLVVVDSRGRLRNWQRIRQEPYWRNAISLCSRATPQSHLAYLQRRHVGYIVTGDDHVDLRSALEELTVRYGVKTVRVDSGGILNGVLLRAGLVDEVSVLICPALVGGTSPRSIFTAPDLTLPDDVIPLKLIHLEQLRGDVVWLRYEVMKSNE
jgi:2,5-diamino-6-(ribosylamino)-4(3H)-pyrimidinone 5'-phosphate reductase